MRFLYYAPSRDHIPVIKSLIYLGRLFIFWIIYWFERNKVPLFPGLFFRCTVSCTGRICKLTFPYVHATAYRCLVTVICDIELDMIICLELGFSLSV